MSESNVKKVLYEIAMHTHTLEVGLQNAAPAQVKIGGSIEYLRDISAKLIETCEKIDNITNNKEAGHANE